MKEIILIPNSKIRKLGDAYILWGHDYKFINEVIADGFHVKIIAHIEAVLDYEGGIETKASNSLSFVDVELSGGKNVVWNYISTYCRTFVALVQTLISRPDFIYIYYPSRIGLMAGFLSRIFRVKYGMYLRGSWIFSRLDKIISDLLFRSSDFIITTGVEFSEQVSSVQSNVQPVVPMINIEGFSEETLSERRDKSAAPFTVLFVGRILKEKGVLDLVWAVKKLVDNKENVRLLIAGMGSDEEVNALEEEIDRGGLSEFVAFLGHIGDKEQLAELYRTSDLFVFPSYYPEGFPRVIYEAMLNRLPVACTLLPGMGGFMKPGENCVEVSPKSPSHLSIVIHELSTDEKRLKNIADQGFDDAHRYLASFTHSSHAMQVTDNVNASMAMVV